MLRNILWFRRRHVHGHVFHELLKLISPRDEIGLAVYLDKHADLTAHVNVLADDSFGGNAPFAFLGGRQPTFTKDVDGNFVIAARFD